MKLKTRSNRPRIRSWEADPDVAKLLNLTVITTGASLKGIVNEAIRTHAPVLVRRLAAERKYPRRKLEALLNSRFHEANHSPKSK